MSDWPVAIKTKVFITEKATTSRNDRHYGIYDANSCILNV